jgi:hypothetical protein
MSASIFEPGPRLKPSFYLERQRAHQRCATAGMRVNGKSYRWLPERVHVTATIGLFGSLLIGDPCYTHSHASLALRLFVPAGPWDVLAETADVGRRGSRCVALALKRPDVRLGALDEIAVARIGVDTGGVWALDAARIVDEASAKAWDDVARKTFTHPWPARYPRAERPVPLGRRGVFVHSGLGDGLYDVFVARDSGGDVGLVLIDFTYSAGESLIERTAT